MWATRPVAGNLPRVAHRHSFQVVEAVVSAGGGPPTAHPLPGLASTRYASTEASAEARTTPEARLKFKKTSENFKQKSNFVIPKLSNVKKKSNKR